MFGFLFRKSRKSQLHKELAIVGVEPHTAVGIIFDARGKMIEATPAAQKAAQTAGVENVQLVLPENYEALVKKAIKGRETVIEKVVIGDQNWFWTFRCVHVGRVLAIAKLRSMELTAKTVAKDTTVPAESGSYPEGASDILSSLSLATCITDDSFKICASNEAFNGLFEGIESRAANIFSLLPVGNQSSSLIKVLNSKNEIRQLRIDSSSKGSSFWNQQRKIIEVSAHAMLQPDGKKFLWTLKDVTREAVIEQSYQYFKHKFDSTIQAASEGIWEWSKFGHGQDWWSDVMFKLLNLDKKTASPSLGQLKRLMHPSDIKVFNRRVDKELVEARAFKMECRLTVKDSGFRWFMLRAVATLNQEGEVVKIVGSLVDIHKEKSARMQLQREKNKVMATLDSIVDAVISTNRDGIIEYMNSAASRLTGLSIKHAVGRHVDKLLTFYREYTSDPIDNPICECLVNGERMQHKIYADMLDLNGTRYTVQVMVAPLISADKKVFGAVLVLNDVTNIRVLSRRLKYQASHDILTKLLNRSEYERRVKQSIQVARVEQVNSVLMYVDLDRFKLINDICGHIAGDELLKQIAKLIKGICRRGDSVARIGGDEFALLLDDCSLEASRKVAEKILTDISSYRFSWDSKTFNIEASIGVAEINEHCEGLAYILNAVDGACYLAKEAGRNCIKEFKEGDEKLAERRGLERSLQRFDYVMEHDQFELYAQPIQKLDPSGQQEVSFEILIRMFDEDGKMIPPNAFLPAVERFNRAYKLDLWIIRHVFIFLHKHADMLNKIGKCSINLSGQSLAEEGLLEYVIQQAAHYKIPTNKICFEITETAAIANMTTAIDLIHALKSEGFLFALDDFGAGLSSFAYLKSMPVDFLKIDGIFVKDIHQDEVNRAMVKAITDMGRVLNKKTIAEYVENQEIVDILREIGVDYGQGFYLGKPMPVADLMQKLQAKSLFRKAKVA